MRFLVFHALIVFLASYQTAQCLPMTTVNIVDIVACEQCSLFCTKRPKAQVNI